MPLALHHHVRRKPQRLSAVPMLLALAACGGEGSGRAPLIGEPTPIPSPALEGSGEPHLSHGEDGALLSWLEPTGRGDEMRLAFSTYREGSWSGPRTIVESDAFFVNWADFPSVEQIDGVLIAHWLQRGGQATYDYGVRVSRSMDGGESWSEAWIPHEDGTPTEHGFVTMFPTEGGTGLVWLDGRNTVGREGEEAPMAMSLRTRTLGRDGRPGPELAIDSRVCDCCQTDAAVASAGPVVVYRNRTEDEIRDIYVARLVDGTWTEGEPVHDDGWNIASCPVNGPAVAAAGDRVAVAWFTGAGGEFATKVALSEDGGASFGEPIRIDDGTPAGRVDVVLLSDGSALVSWIERTASGDAEIRIRRVSDEGASPSSTLTVSSEERASGFPMMLALSDTRLLAAWTDVEGGDSRVLTAVVEVRP